MKKRIIIIGGGIVGSTLAFYLSQSDDYHLTLIDEGNGCATRAAAGIICPWLSQRRNKDWYRLTAQGAAFYPQLMEDLRQAGHEQPPYQQTGTLVFKKKESLLKKLYQMAEERQADAPMIGELSLYSPEGLKDCISELESPQGAVLASGGGRVDGSALLDQLQASVLKNGGEIRKGHAQLLSPTSVQVDHLQLDCDLLILTAGAWLPTLLQPLQYAVDIRPQKGQLIEVQTNLATDTWPGFMLHGEIDILPFEEGKIVIGATHEDQMGYDLTSDPQLLAEMKEQAGDFLPDLQDYPISKTRVGTRAYTSDYAPFYGPLADQPHIWVASGLGSSGLTSGPFIGWHMAQEIMGQHPNFDRQAYSPHRYITKKG